MTPPSRSTYDLARQLVAASQTASDPHVNAVAVTELLRISLTRFAGADGFESLQRRAWTLASAEVPTLQNMKVGKGGRLEVSEQLADNGFGIVAIGAGDAANQPAVAITAHLLELMFTFIGKRLTLRLVLEAWPDISLDEWQSKTEADQ